MIGADEICRASTHLRPASSHHTHFHPHFFFGTTNPNRAAFSSHVHRHAGAFFSRACASHRAGCAIASGASHAGTQCVDRASVGPHEPRDPPIGAEMTQ